ncbi:RDD family protein [Pseudenhygromyxa sp. WMMC2535]|uniref:RDD family protein n=1 Tax=Pseudenhygromyxa sp. WMMC2535 TaxID=2712867 RepID=UPI0015559A50|nr:RDD family protein [Pseudenhygromyxa sp. WMMC2535]NVB39524.1 RDD family protein [Pseudenhygromyxa sp. WMMC2535]
MTSNAGRFVPRAVALFIDLVLIGALTSLLAGLFGVDSHGALASLVSWLYFASQESSGWMATVGKRLMGLVVQGVDGRQLSFGRASLRWAARWLSSLAMGLGYLLALFNERRQTLHDLIAGTVVTQRS